MIILMALALFLPMMVSCESIKETLQETGLLDSVKAKAKEWINKHIDEFGVEKDSPVLVVEAEEIEDVALRDEVLSQLKKPAVYKVAPKSP